MPNPTGIKLWQFEDIGLIGRNDILQEMCRRILEPTKCFILEGRQGIGKTALLEWAYENHFEIGANAKPKPVQMEDCAFVNAGEPLSSIYKKIINDWNLDMPREKNNDALAAVIMSVQGKTLYIDDLQEASKQKLRKFITIGRFNKINGVINIDEKLKYELNSLVVGRQKITVLKLDRRDALRLAGNIALHYKQDVDLNETVNKARKKPLDIVSIITTGEIPKGSDDLYTENEMLDISPVLLVILVAVMLMRMMGKAMEATDFMIIGSLTMLVRLFLMMFMRGNK